MVGRRGISIKGGSINPIIRIYRTTLNFSFLKIIKPDAESILYLHPAYLCIPLFGLAYAKEVA